MTVNVFNWSYLPPSVIFMTVLVVPRLCYASKAEPEDLPPELLCLGCEASVKELDMFLTKPSNNPMKRRVEDVLEKLCKLEIFKNYEYSPAKLAQACKEVIGRNKKTLIPMLVDHYSDLKNHKHTYLEIVHEVCNHKLRVCAGGHDHEEDGKTQLYLDKDTKEFKVKPGDNIKVANPVRETRQPDEL